MTLAEYQEFAKKNWMPGCDEVVFALGLGGECGEVLEILKKARRSNSEIPMESLVAELGDVMWYIANLCTSYQLSMQDVLDYNVVKLNARYPQRNVDYRKNGPHIEMFDKDTGKHIKFCKASELQKDNSKLPWEE